MGEGLAPLRSVTGVACQSGPALDRALRDRHRRSCGASVCARRSGATWARVAGQSRQGAAGGFDGSQSNPGARVHAMSANVRLSAVQPGRASARPSAASGRRWEAGCRDSPGAGPIPTPRPPWWLGMAPGGGDFGLAQGECLMPERPKSAIFGNTQGPVIERPAAFSTGCKCALRAGRSKPIRQPGDARTCGQAAGGTAFASGLHTRRCRSPNVKRAYN
jgi:hypothetical protein